MQMTAHQHKSISGLLSFNNVLVIRLHSGYVHQQTLEIRTVWQVISF